MINPLAWLRKRGRQAAPAPARRTFSSAYAGAAVNRLTASMATWSGSANAEIEGSLPILRSRARALVANHEYARRFLSLTATHVVGADGPTLQVRARMASGDLDQVANAAVEEHWRRWSRTAEITGRMTLAHALRVIVKAVARDGEALVRFIRDRRQPYGIAIQLLEADRLDEAINMRLANGNTVRMGVELDSTGRPVAYHVKRDHPGESMLGAIGGTERIPVEEMIHVFLPERAEQTRGASWFHAVIMRMNMLHSYEEAAVIAARVGASKMGFFKRSESDDVGAAGQAVQQLADGSVVGTLNMQVEPGELMELPPGYDFANFDPDYPHENFDDFIRACLRGIAAGLDVDYSTLANDLENVNYSSMRAGTVETRDQWTLLQGWFIDALVLRIYEEWLQTAFLGNAITFLDTGRSIPPERFRKFYDASWFVGRRWQWVDPLKDAQAARELIAAKLASRTAIAAAQGRDFDDVVADLAAEEEKIKAAGLQDQPSAASSAPATMPDPEDEAFDEAAPDAEADRKARRRSRQARGRKT